MPTFHYRAYGARGELAEGSIEAASQDAANDLLWTQGLTAFQFRLFEQADKKWWQRDLFSGQGASRTDLAVFIRELATLSAAELPLDDALRIMSDQVVSSGARTLATTLLGDILNGSTLSDAMQKQSHVFSTECVNIVRAGEIGGTLGDVLGELADLLERRLEIRVRIQSALVYPAMLIALSVISLAIIIGTLVPSIAPIFAENGKPMPTMIRSVLTIQDNWLEILAVIIVMSSAAALSVSLVLRRPEARLALDNYKLIAPGFGAFILQHETARFARTLGTLLKSGVPLLQASTSASATIGNRYMAAGLDRAINAVREGASLHHALRSETALPPIALRMISIGEEAGKLDRMLLRIAAMFEQQTQRSIERFMTILTPLLTVIIAIVVGSVVMTVMNAVLSVNELAVR